MADMSFVRASLSSFGSSPLNAAGSSADNPPTGKPPRQTDGDSSSEIDVALRRSEDRCRHLETELAECLKLSKSKDEFISLASHQLRTPATGVKQYLGMLLGNFGGQLNDSQRLLVQHAYDSNERQLNVVTDLLSVAQADAGKLDLHRHEVELVSFIDSILDEQVSKFSDRRQQVDFRHAGTECIVSIDKSRMRMVLENLVDNASKYTPEGRRIDVSLSRPHQPDDPVQIAIADQGVGIARKDLETIFDKFVRAENPLSDSVGGSGLGLYLAKKIVELHDGHIGVTSQPGRGSTFTVSLPSS